ncbi:uncharacterized protein UBRO_20485 [Ustilago bromivora]|uniref:Uncharacterized protein n=1 Tax=Ustilago bromivora TaxID=307758 RepID=A0A1K0GJQ6_9BASI|nr:uncharacterized protein UBRO_20485 [Ustilago bromivora]SYW86305.1 uncharacterized protein UBRO2_06025 [Ustilago bromivora]
MYWTQPLYDSGGPVCMEPTIILAQLAKEDSVFDHGISIASMMETADPEYFENVDKFLPIPIKAEAKDHFIVKSYLSQRNIVDIQGLVKRGKESKNHIMLHGLHHVKAITDTPNSLHAVANAGIESMPIIQRLVHEYNQAKVALSKASAQGLPAHKYQALKVGHKKKMKHLIRTQCQLRCQTMIEHAYKEKEDLNVCALLGSVLGGAGPAAVAQELSQHLQAGGDTNDNDGSDQAGSSMMHQANDLADVSSPASGTSLSAKEPLSLHLHEKLDGLCNQIGSMIGDLPQPEYDLLKKDGASMPFHELFAAMMTNNKGLPQAGHLGHDD